MPISTRGFIAFLLLLSFAHFSWASVGEAKSLIDSKQYQKALESLKADIENENPEALLLGIDAAIGEGKFVTANRYATSWIKVTGGKDPEALSKSALVASLVGQEKLAISRYLNYVAMDQGKSESLKEALTYLMRKGSFPDVVKKYLDTFGFDDRIKSLGMRQLERLLDNKDDDNFALILPLLMKGAQKDLDYQEELVDFWYEALRSRDRLQSGEAKAKAFEAFRYITIDQYRKTKDIFNRSDDKASPSDICDIVLDHSISINRARWWVPRELSDNFSKIKDRTEVAKLAKKCIDAMAQVDNNPHYLLIAIASSPEVFRSKENPYLDKNGVFNLFEKGLKNIDRPWKLESATDDLVQNLLRSSERVEFFRKYAEWLAPQTFRHLNDIDNLGDIDSALSAYQKEQPQHMVLLAKGHLLKIYSEKGSLGQKVEALKAHVESNPGDWNSDLIRDRFFGNSKDDADTKFNALKSSIAKTGDFKRAQNLARDIDRRLRNLKDEKSFKDFEAFVKKEQEGTDSLLSALRELEEKRVDDRKHDKSIDAIVEKALGQAPKNFPADETEAKSLQEHMLLQLFFKHIRHNHRAESGIASVVEIWTPRFNSFGQAWKHLDWRMNETNMLNRKGAALTYVKNYTRLIRSKNDVEDYFLDFVSNGIHPKNDKSTPMSSIYPHLGSAAFAYVTEQFDAWPDSVFNEQVLKILNNKNIPCTNDELNSFAYRLSRIEKTSRIQPDLVQTMAQRYADSLRNQEREAHSWLEGRFIEILLKFNGPEATVTWLESMKPLIQKRPPAQQVDSVRNFVNVNNGLHDSLKKIVYEDILQQATQNIKAEDWSEARLDYRMFEDLSRMNDVGQALIKSLADGIFNGADPVRNQDRYLRYLNEPMMAHVGALGWKKLMSYLFEYADIIRRDRDWSSTYNNHVKPIFDKLVTLEAPEVALAFLSRLEDIVYNDKDQALKQIAVLKAQVSKDIEGIVGVDKNDPTYDLHMASQALRQGAETRAWQFTEPKLALLEQNFATFDIQYVAWAIDQMRKQKFYKEALNFSFKVLMDEFSLGAEDAAQVGLIKGDIYRDMQNYQAARIEYESLQNNQRYKSTPAGQDAVIRLIELLILTNDYANAEQQLERLIDSSSVRMQAEAFYLYARIAYDQSEYAEAAEYLEKVFKRIDGHVKSRLLEGELKLKLPRGLANTEVAIGNPRLKTVIVPGKVLTLRLQDSNLSIARGGQAIPIVVQTGRGKDEEKVQLMAGAEDPYTFVGTVRTSLGQATPHNFVLEIMGNEQVSYVIDPEFQKANNVTYDPKYLTVKSNGRLMASAGRILSPEEMEAKLLEEKLIKAGRAKKKSGRDGNTVRPGSPIYIEVTDLDQNVSNEKDRVSVRLNTSSGDEIRSVPLQETDHHSGVFRGEVATGIPFPMVKASDATEGLDPNAIINSTRSTSWVSVADGQKPKWIEVDTMSSHDLKSVELIVPDPDAITNLRLEGSLSGGFAPLASFPENKQKLQDGLQLSKAPRPRRGFKNLSDTREYLNRAQQELVDKTSIQAKASGRDYRDGLVARLSGSFYLESDAMLEFQVLFSSEARARGQFTVVVDGREFLEGGLTTELGIKTHPHFLVAGAHRLEVFVESSEPSIDFVLGHRFQSVDTFNPMSKDRFLISNHPELKEFLRPKGEITKLSGSYMATIRTYDRFRKLRWVFDDFKGASVEVKEVRVTDKSAKTILPTTNDFTTGKSNDTLEVAGGDQIEVSYEDQLRLNDDQPVLIGKLNASFFNGSISIRYEHINAKDELVTTSAKRVLRGDILLIEATDYDEDLTPEPDTLKAKVRTTSRESLELELLETENQSGVFRQVIKLGESTDPKQNMIKLNPNDILTASFLDKENTDPSIPIERQSSVTAVEQSEYELSVYPSYVERVEDTSEKAQASIASLKRKLKTDADLKIYKDVATVNTRYKAKPGPNGDHPPVSVTHLAPITFAVTWPSKALHGMSRVKLEAVAESEIQKARAENREPKKKRFSAGVGRLDEGTFSGRLEVNVGDQVMDASSLLGEEAQGTGKLSISGSDNVYLSLLDDEGATLLTRSVFYRSDARLELLDPSYTAAVNAIHLGQRFYVRVQDMDRNTSADQDIVNVNVTSSSGDELELILSETVPQSGIFTASFEPIFWEESPDGQKVPMDKNDNKLMVNFGDTITTTYTDPTPLTGAMENKDEPTLSSVVGKIHYGADAEIASFTKRFKDPEMAVKTRFLMAEALFEIAKDYRKLKREEEADVEISRGKRILEEAMRDYPNTTLVAQGEFLLANLAEELEKYDEAIGRYTNIIAHHSDSEYAPRAQFKKALCLEKLERYEKACEEYVKLTYIYPEHKLVSDATVRLGNYYYKEQLYDTAGRVFVNFANMHQAHPLAPKALFLGAQSYIKKENDKKDEKTRNYYKATEALSSLIEKFEDDKAIRAEAMYWLADCYSKDGAHKESYQTFKRLTWDYPESKWAKIARGRLTEKSFQGFD